MEAGPEAPVLSGMLLGVVIVLAMRLRPGGIMGNEEIEGVLLRVRNRRSA